MDEETDPTKAASRLRVYAYVGLLAVLLAVLTTAYRLNAPPAFLIIGIFVAVVLIVLFILLEFLLRALGPENPTVIRVAEWAIKGILGFVGVFFTVGSVMFFFWMWKNIPIPSPEHSRLVVPTITRADAVEDKLHNGTVFLEWTGGFVGFSKLHFDLMPCKSTDSKATAKRYLLPSDRKQMQVSFGPDEPQPPKPWCGRLVLVELDGAEIVGDWQPVQDKSDTTDKPGEL